MNPKYEMDPEIVACAYEALLPGQLRAKMQALDTEMEDVAAMKKYVLKQLNATQPIDGNNGGAKNGAKAYLLDGEGGQQQADPWSNWGGDKTNLSEEEQQTLASLMKKSKGGSKGGGGQKKENPNIECWGCLQKGHPMHKCPTPWKWPAEM